MKNGPSLMFFAIMLNGHIQNVQSGQVELCGVAGGAREGCKGASFSADACRGGCGSEGSVEPAESVVA
jgi:hypothetical protein